MLTLTRKIGESVCIGDDIKIVVKEIKGKQVRIGISAPKDVYVCREELYLKIHQANLMASSTEANVLDSLSDLFANPPTVAMGDEDDGSETKEASNAR